MSDAICPRLIEVALPIRELSAESLRQKKAQRGHISTLHLWWARRPLSAARAIVFASLVPDPDDPACPPEFAAAVATLLRDRVPGALTSYWRGRRRIPDSDPYLPYGGLDDTPRNRLLMFIARWSPEWLQFERGERSKQPLPPEMLDDRCLVKWETGDPENEQGQAVLCVARELVRAAYGGNSPTLLDPFSGGGAIPLEAGRLGCQPIANDYNPVAYLILRATCEYPQRYGRPAVMPAEEFSDQQHPESKAPQGRRKRKAQQEQSLLTSSISDIAVSSRMQSTAEPADVKIVSNLLIHDVEHWVKWIVERARKELGDLYRSGNDGLPVAGYLWARTVPCSNPTCRSQIPLVRNLLVGNKEGKKVALTMSTHDGQVAFGIAQGRAIGSVDGTMLGRGDCRCPICAQITPVEDIRQAGLRGALGERMIAVILATPQGKTYRVVESSDIDAFKEATERALEVERPGEYIVPEVNAPNTPTDSGPHRSISVDLYGLKTFGSLFNPRQLLAMQTLTRNTQEALVELRKRGVSDDYFLAIATYLGLWISRCSARYCSVTVWNKGEEKFEHPFGRQAIPMTWDYPEPNPFVEGSAGLLDAWDLARRVIVRESIAVTPAFVLNRDAARLPLEAGLAHVVVTDPPYFDAVAYADLSDFFYVWLKRSLHDVMPDVFSTPQTPKAEEAVAHKHRHRGDRARGKDHFQRKLAASLEEASRICHPSGVVAVMFAHQSTEAWTALINSVFAAGLTITATYPVDTELTTALKKGISALESSITVICRPRVADAAAAYRAVRRQIESAVSDSVHRFWNYGFRGADLIVACYGPAVGVFGQYERVERADGTEVSVTELLQFVRESALKAIAGEFTGDPLSRLYFVWANI